MIYKKDANFPYPILTNTSNSYDNCSFILDINLEENTNEYIFEINYDITSPFIEKLLQNGQATLILIIQSKDNKFFNLEYGQKTKSISKSRISLSKRTTIQLFIQSNEEINFKNKAVLLKDVDFNFKSVAYFIYSKKRATLVALSKIILLIYNVIYKASKVSCLFASGIGN